MFSGGGFVALRFTPTSKGVFHPGQGGCFQGQELEGETLFDQALITFCSSA